MYAPQPPCSDLTGRAALRTAAALLAAVVSAGVTERLKPEYMAMNESDKLQHYKNGGMIS